MAMYESFPTLDMAPEYLNMFSLLLTEISRRLISSSDSQEYGNF